MKKSRRPDISSAALHILAMAIMLCDHFGMVLVPQLTWMRCVGRIAFPIFAFLLVEGFCHTKNLTKYARRLFLCALIAEIPFDLMTSGRIVNYHHQNVLWTFLIALLTIWAMRNTKERLGAASLVITALGYIVGEFAMVDYGGAGILTVLVFYLFRERTLRNYVTQFMFMLVLNAFIVPSTSISVLGFQIPMQTFAVLALLPVWLYRGRQGNHSQEFQYFCYAFYPAHILVLVYLGLVCHGIL